MRVSSTGNTIALFGPIRGPYCMVYALRLPSEPRFASINSLTGNLSEKETLPLLRRADPGPTPFTVMGLADSSSSNSSDIWNSLMSDIRDIADPESNSTRCRLPLGPIAHVYNGVVKTTLMYMAIAGSSGGFHARSGSFSATAMAQN